MPFRALIERGQAGFVQASSQSAHPRADGHLVVIENHQQILAQSAGVVERLKNNARGQSAVADDGHTTLVRAAEDLVADLLRELLQLAVAELMEVGRRMDSGQYLAHLSLPFEDERNQGRQARSM